MIVVFSCGTSTSVDTEDEYSWNKLQSVSLCSLYKLGLDRCNDLEKCYCLRLWWLLKGIKLKRNATLFQVEHLMQSCGVIVKKHPWVTGDIFFHVILLGNIMYNLSRNNTYSTSFWGLKSCTWERSSLICVARGRGKFCISWRYCKNCRLEMWKMSADLMFHDENWTIWIAQDF